MPSPNLDECFASGFSDDDDGIEPERNPSGTV